VFQDTLNGVDHSVVENKESI